jgi:hypothetical protein
LLISAGADNKGIQKLQIGGFFARTADKCSSLEANTARVDFKNDVLMSCQQSFAGLADFKTYCETGDLNKVALINQFLTSFKSVGVFGNADISHNKDWISVITSGV